MQFKFIRRSLFVGISLLSLTAVGCTQLRNFEAEEQNPTSSSSTSSPASSSTSSPGDQAQSDSSATTEAPTRVPDVVYVPTPMSVVNEMLRLANVQSDDVIYDLGSGDGRIVISAAQQYGTRGIGIDIDPQRIQEANENAQKEEVSDRVQFLQQDLFEADFRNATVVTLYLLPELNVKLRPKLLRELKPGTRIVSHAFDMGEWEADETVEVDGKTVYYWVVPENPPANFL